MYHVYNKYGHVPKMRLKTSKRSRLGAFYRALWAGGFQGGLKLGSPANGV